VQSLEVGLLDDEVDARMAAWRNAAVMNPGSERTINASP